MSDNATPEDLNTAYFLAHCSNYAYENADTLSSIFAGSAWTFEADNFIENSATSTQCFIIYAGAGPNWIVLAFRGTETAGLLSPYFDAWTDILTNINSVHATPWSDSTPEIKVAYGFKSGWDSVKATVLQKLTNLIIGGTDNVKLYVTGHSLGAALATLAVVDIFNEFPGIDLTVYTYGSPVVGNQAFADMFNNLVKDSSGQGITSEYFLDPNDPIETWANWYLTCTAFKLAGQECFARVNNQHVLNKEGTGHSILNYMTLLIPSGDNLAVVPSPINGETVQTPTNPMRSRTSFLAESPVSQIVLRIYTSPTYSASTTDQVVFWWNVDSTGKNDFRQGQALADGNHSKPFQRGYIDTFTWSPSSAVSFGDLPAARLQSRKTRMTRASGSFKACSSFSTARNCSTTLTSSPFSTTRILTFSSAG